MTARSKGNPFAQSPHYWNVIFSVPQAAVATAEEAFNDITLAVSSFVTDEAKGIWTFELLCETLPDMEDIHRRLLLLAKLHSISLPRAEVKQLEQKDWLKQTASSFPPLSIGRFYVYGSHVTQAPPAGSLPIRVDAGAAFGSGEHGTTSACLKAMDWLARRRAVDNVLDMGCGSGILAIAAAKLWNAEVLAADIDPVAVRVTQENIRINHEQGRVGVIVSDGYAAERVRRQGPYDLIISNILARPLIKFAPDLARHLEEGGSAILSGLLDSQEPQVLSAHLMQGLRLQRRFLDRGWCTLVLGR